MSPIFRERVPGFAHERHKVLKRPRGSARRPQHYLSVDFEALPPKKIDSKICGSRPEEVLSTGPAAADGQLRSKPPSSSRTADLPYMSLGDKREQSPLLLRYFEAPRGAEKRRDPRVSQSQSLGASATAQRFCFALKGARSNFD